MVFNVYLMDFLWQYRKASIRGTLPVYDALDKVISLFFKKYANKKSMDIEFTNIICQFFFFNFSLKIFFCPL